MKLILFIILFSPLVVLSQGFDWQVSTREPYEITDIYVGAIAGFSLNTHSGKFPFLENAVQCCNYGNGSGTTVQFGLGTEYWLEPTDAISASLLYSIVGANFRNETTVLKKTNPDTREFSWTTAYESEISLSYLTFDFALKRRIYEKLNVKAGFDLNFFLTSSQAHKNIVVEPSNIPFADGTFEKEIENGNIGEISSFVLGVQLGISYDINLGLERYGELNLLTNYTVNSIVSDENWRNFQAKLAAKVYMGVR